MSERPDELRDDFLGARLKSVLGTTPSRLTSRLEHLTAAGLHAGRPERPPTPVWLEVGPQSVGMALSIALLAGVMSRLLALIRIPPPFDAQLPAVHLLASPAALTSLVLPIGVLLCVEAMRGAPTVRRWLR